MCVSSFAQEIPSHIPGWVTSDTTLPKTIRTLRTDLQDVLADSVTNNTSVSTMVYSLKTKELLYSRNEYKSLMPASTMKIITTAVALEQLGHDFTFTTTVFLDGIIKSNGEYIGNVIIRGAGDPSLSSYFMPDPMAILNKWAQALDSLGIKSIRGNIIGDNSYFDDAPLGNGWSWDDIPYSFSAEISALSFNDNKVDLTIRAGRSINTSPSVVVIPTNSTVTVNNLMNTVPVDSTRSIDYWRELTNNVVEIKGTMPFDTTSTKEHQRTISVAVHNPTHFFVSLLKQTLKERGIVVNGEVFDIRQWGNKRIAYTDLRPVINHTSPPLSEIVRVINTFSHNLAAEMLLRTLGKETSGIGSAEKGVLAIREFCKQKAIPLEGTQFVDGSGLSRSNLVTARLLTGVLNTMYQSQNRAVFFKSLATPTERGTLFGRMKNSLAERAIRAKTGTLSGVSALAGYIQTRDQEPLVFALIFNNFTIPSREIRAIQDFFCMRLASFTRK